jgi:nucleoside-diphosphate-sugar epimerase
MTQIFVTGFDGYVGAHVVSALRARGIMPSVMARNDAAAAKATAQGLGVYRVTIEDIAALTQIAASVDGIVHCAARDNPAFLPTNAAAVDAMISGLRDGASFIMHGGTMVFGDTGRDGAGPNPAFNPPPPLAPRAALDCRVLEETRVRTGIAFGAFVFGGTGAMIPQTLVAAAQKTGASGYPGDGGAIWSAVHVADWGDLIARMVLADGAATGAMFAAAQTITIGDAAQAVASGLSPPLPVRAFSSEEAQAAWGFFGAALSLNQLFNAGPARTRLGWSPTPRDIAAELSAPDSRQ